MINTNKTVLLQEMDKQTERMDIKLKEEMRWLQRGVTAKDVIWVD